MPSLGRYAAEGNGRLRLSAMTSSTAIFRAQTRARFEKALSFVYKLANSKYFEEDVLSRPITRRIDAHGKRSKDQLVLSTSQPVSGILQRSTREGQVRILRVIQSSAAILTNN
jgi:hypothetical protein